MNTRAFAAHRLPCCGLLLALLLPVLWLPMLLHAAEVKGVRLWRAPDNTRLVFDLSGPVAHTLQDAPASQGNAQRLIVTMPGGRAGAQQVDTRNTPVDAVVMENGDKELRVLIDLAKRVKPKSFLLPANEQYGHRLVVDLFDEDGQEEIRVVKPVGNGLRDIVIAVDAGHGGEDPGAKGPGGVYEKNVTLSMAKELVKLINDTPGYSAFLTRSGDYYISLRGRTQLARKKGADLFVSIHADAFKDSSARGAGVFALSQRGATSETARWLAQKENDADLVGGVNLGDKDPMLQEVLLDLSMTATVATSLDMGDKVYEQLKKVAKMHRGYVEQAGFAVLKNPDIPSLLVETGFITNPTEAKQLSDPAYRNKLTRAIFAGIDSHFRSKPPMDTALAAARGDRVQWTMDKIKASSDTQSEDALADAVAVEERGKTEIPQQKAVTVRRDTGSQEKADAEDELQKLLKEKNVSASNKMSKGKTAGASTAKKITAKTVEHKVSKGETLSGIAARYKVSMLALRDHNKLPDQTIRIGQTLRIPATQ